MSRLRKRKHSIPGLNTSSLPDLIFTVLFFFMIVTHMRSVPLKVRYQVPEGTELTRLVKKSTVTYIYIGKPFGSEETRIQLNDKLADVDAVAPYVKREQASMLSEDNENMTVSIRADKGTQMGIINDVKQALRRAGALNINYSATEKRNNSKAIVGEK